MSLDYSEWNKLYASENGIHADAKCPVSGQLIAFILNSGSIQYVRYGIASVTSVAQEDRMTGGFNTVIEFKRGLEPRHCRFWNEIEYWKQLGSIYEIPKGVLTDIQLAETKHLTQRLDVFPKDMSEEDFFNGNAKPVSVLRTKA